MYYLVYGFLYGLSLLPLKVLYLLSDFVYALLYYVFQYRKDVVMGNLTIAFPEKTEKEKTVIAKKFYKNFTDTFIETIKLFSVGKKFLDRHVTADYSIVHKLAADGRKSQAHFGHNFNWEVCNLAAALHVRQKFLGVYMPLENKTFDKIFRDLRSKYGTILIPAKDMRNAMMPYRNEPYVLGLVADQSPADPVAGYWIHFFGRPTSFVRGPEKGAVAGNLPVIFGHITKRKRGYYELHFELAADQPATLQPGELTKRYVKYLERVITEQPEMWLWSHRRWKIQWTPEMGPVL